MKHFYPPLAGVCSNTSLSNSIHVSSSQDSQLPYLTGTRTVFPHEQEANRISFTVSIFRFCCCIMLAGPLWGRLVSIHNPVHGGAGVIMMTPFLARRRGTDHDCKCLLTYCPRRCSAHYYANSFLWLARLCCALPVPALLSRRPSLISHSGHRSAWL